MTYYIFNIETADGAFFGIKKNGEIEIKNLETQHNMDEFVKMCVVTMAKLHSMNKDELWGYINPDSTEMKDNGIERVK